MNDVQEVRKWDELDCTVLRHVYEALLLWVADYESSKKDCAELPVQQEPVATVGMLA